MSLGARLNERADYWWLKALAIVMLVLGRKSAALMTFDRMLARSLVNHFGVMSVQNDLKTVAEVRDQLEKVS